MVSGGDCQDNIATRQSINNTKIFNRVYSLDVDGKFDVPSVFFVSPLNLTRTEDLETISDSEIFIFLSTSSWMKLTELCIKVRLRVFLGEIFILLKP